MADDVDVDVDVVEPRTGDRLLLCSDGLWDEVGDELIGMVLGGRKDPEDAASELLRWAKEAGGRDNITVLVLDVVDGGEVARGAAASAALDAAGEERTATSRSDAAPTAAVPAEDVGQAGLPPGAPSPWDRPGGGGAAQGRAPDVPLMQGGDAGLMPSGRPPRLLTWRVLLFVVVLLGVLGAAALIVARAEPAWSVAVDNNEVVVKQGDKIEKHTGVRPDQLTSLGQNELQGSGHKVKDLAEAERYLRARGFDAALAGNLPVQGGGTVETVPSPTSARASIPSTAGAGPTTSRLPPTSTP